MTKTALIAGATGITGNNLAAYLIASGWTVYGLSRRATEQSGVIPVEADLLSPDSLDEALSGLQISRLFYCTWIRRDTEDENVKANGAMMRNLFNALECSNLEHASLVTGTKQYLGSFEAYGSGRTETPFRESEPRVPGANFYYELEDVLFEAAEKHGFAWNVHRPHTVIGHALGNAMNMGTTLAVYASICKETGQPFVFPGSEIQWNALTDMTDALVLARQMEWASTTPGAWNQAFNVVNGDVFRWRRLWCELGEYFGLEVIDDPEAFKTLDAQMEGMDSVWRDLAKTHGLVEPDIDKLVSWWHTDADLGRDQECVNDMTKSREFGFHYFCNTRSAFCDLFDRLRAERIIP
ncbi:SDR family oxidoreductase [Larsenimonas salina]|uniref:SDR family oxidoreductase n=1 Tax=Larsenimonas salina TaxID=1295565 RepID=UPI00207316F3|nr:SDR family oxidoreductase [Larsenimonas salina]